MIYTDRYQRKGTFQNLCFGCEQRLHDDRAEKWCADDGLITTAQKIAYCREAAKRMFPGLRFVERRERDAGEDDEEMAA